MFIWNGTASRKSEHKDNISGFRKRPITVSILRENCKNSKTLFRTFKSKCNLFSITETKAVEDFYFNILGFDSIISRIGQEYNKNPEDGGGQEKIKLNAKMWKVSSNGFQDAFWKERAAFPDLWHSGFESRFSKEAR